MPYIGFYIEESIGNKPVAKFDILGMARGNAKIIYWVNVTTQLKVGYFEYAEKNSINEGSSSTAFRNLWNY